MLGDSLLYSPNITRTSEQGGIAFAGWVSGVGVRPVHLGWGPCKSVKIQNPIWTAADPNAGNPWNLLVGVGSAQTIEMSPGVVNEFECDRLEYLWIARRFDYSVMAADNTTALTVGFWGHADPPVAPYESSGPQNRNLFQRLQSAIAERLGLNGKGK